MNNYKEELLNYCQEDFKKNDNEHIYKGLKDIKDWARYLDDKEEKREFFDMCESY